MRSTRSPRPSSSTNRNRPGSRGQLAGRRTAAGRARAATGRRSARPPASPVCGETITLRDQLVGPRRQQPGRLDRLDDLGRERAVRRPAGARSWRLARPVRCTSPSPYVAATSPSAASEAAGIRPPTSRSRTSAPSSAGQGRRTPGQRSRRDVRVRCSWTGSFAVRGSCAKPALTSRRSPQGPAGLRTRDRPVRGAFPDPRSQWLSSGCRATCPARHPYRCASVPDSHRVPCASVHHGGVDWPGHATKQSQRRARPHVAGPSSTSPSRPNRLPWSGQSQLCSASFQRTTPPRWVQTADARCSKPLLRETAVGVPRWSSRT